MAQAPLSLLALLPHCIRIGADAQSFATFMPPASHAEGAVGARKNFVVVFSE
jgi:hypothetical protein